LADYVIDKYPVLADGKNLVAEANVGWERSEVVNPMKEAGLKNHNEIEALGKSPSGKIRPCLHHPPIQNSISITHGRC
jgi:hypothetical protein